MAGSELLGMVDAGALERIRAIDSHPEFRAYAIGHEGTADMQIRSLGRTVPIRWLREAVGWLHNAITVGIAAFNRHLPDSNTHEGRNRVGEVVGKRLVEVANRVTTIVAMYIYPEYRNLPLDVASIEADMQFGIGEGGQVYPTGVGTVTGIALSSREIDRPGFPGATLLGAVAAFAHGEGATTMATKSEVRDAVRELKLSPSDLFEPDAVLADAVVDRAIKAANKNVYDQSARVEAENKALRDQLATKDNEFKAELAKAQANVVRTRAGTVLATLATERKIGEKEKRYIELRLPTLQTEAADEAKLREDVNKFIDAQLADYKTTAELFGVKTDTVGVTTPAVGVLPDGNADTAPDIVAPGSPETYEPVAPGQNPLVKHLGL